MPVEWVWRADVLPVSEPRLTRNGVCRISVLGFPIICRKSNSETFSQVPPRLAFFNYSPQSSKRDSSSPVSTPYAGASLGVV